MLETLVAATTNYKKKKKKTGGGKDGERKERSNVKQTEGIEKIPRGSAFERRNNGDSLSLLSSFELSPR